VGSVHEWAVLSFSVKHTEKAHSYRELDQLINAVSPEEKGALFLPYLNSERFPVKVSQPAGSFLRLGAATTSAQMARAVLEGIAFSIRQSMETLTTFQERSEEHTSELQSRFDLVCRLLLAKKKQKKT